MIWLVGPTLVIASAAIAGQGQGTGTDFSIWENLSHMTAYVSYTSKATWMSVHLMAWINDSSLSTAASAVGWSLLQTGQLSNKNVIWQFTIHTQNVLRLKKNSFMSYSGMKCKQIQKISLRAAALHLISMAKHQNVEITWKQQQKYIPVEISCEAHCNDQNGMPGLGGLWQWGKLYSMLILIVLSYDATRKEEGGCVHLVFGTLDFHLRVLTRGR